MKVSILITFLSAVSIGAMAQGNFSPYSQLGLGDLEDGYYNRTAGLANTGIAYRNSRFLINNNPASFSAMTNQVFTMETGLRGSIVNYYGRPVDASSNQSGDITFRRLALGMKLAKHWGSSIGLVPFSTQNYEFNVPYYIQGSTDEVANHYFQGHGSINKVYWANSYEFWGDDPAKRIFHKHHISLGVDAGYLFGQLNQKDIIQAPVTNSTLVSTTNSVDLRNLYVSYGMQIYGKLTKKWDYTLGGTFAPKSNIFSETNRNVVGPDSLALQGEQVSQANLTLPNTIGLGIAISHNQKYTFLADYKYQGWNGVKNSYPGKDYTLSNSNKGSIGFEISKKKTFYNNKVELSYFQTGLYYGESYLQISGKQIKDKGITAGFGINSLKSPLAYSMVFQYGIKGTQDNNLIQQRYFNVTFVINYVDLWYTRGKRFD